VEFILRQTALQEISANTAKDRAECRATPTVDVIARCQVDIAENGA
jgi:hypothetical protein